MCKNISHIMAVFLFPYFFRLIDFIRFYPKLDLNLNLLLRIFLNYWIYQWICCSYMLIMTNKFVLTHFHFLYYYSALQFLLHNFCPEHYRLKWTGLQNTNLSVSSPHWITYIYNISATLGCRSSHRIRILFESFRLSVSVCRNFTLFFYNISFGELCTELY